MNSTYDWVYIYSFEINELHLPMSHELQIWISRVPHTIESIYIASRSAMACLICMRVMCLLCGIWLSHELHTWMGYELHICISHELYVQMSLYACDMPVVCDMSESRTLYMNESRTPCMNESVHVWRPYYVGHDWVTNSMYGSCQKVFYDWS